MDNLENLKFKIKKRDIEKIEDWSSYSKKIFFIEKKKENQIKKLPFLNLKLIEKLVKNIEKNKKKELNLKLKKQINIFKLYEIYLKINKSYLKNIILKKTLKNNTKNIFIIIDNRNLKTKIILFNYKKCLFSINNGFVFKKLNLKNKKYKKSEKLSFLCLKNSIIKFNNFKKYKNIFLYIKGIKNNSNLLIKYFNKKVNNKFNENNLLIINSYKISKSTFFGFKKIKAIKRKLKKKMIKIKNQNTQ